MDAAGALAPADSDPRPEPDAEGGEAASADATAAAGTEEKETPAQAATAAQDIAVPPAVGDGRMAGDETPPDRPNKPVLAAVAIGGAVVLAIPILLIGTGSHHTKKHPTAAAADTVLPGAGQQPPPGAFVSSSPTPTPSASPTKKDKPKAKGKATPTPSAKPSVRAQAKTKSGSNERQSPGAPGSLVLHAPRDIYPGQTVRTSRIALTMQSGGDLVLRDRSNKIIWSTGTHSSGAYAEFQTDGNLVLYSGDRHAVWAAGCVGHEHSTLVLQGDYNMVIIDHGGHPIWATGTNR
ncbi:MAG: ftsY [Actinoallomurus sp.]|nr:ftsY [Actinoallomurus sp.]